MIRGRFRSGGWTGRRDTGELPHDAGVMEPIRNFGGPHNWLREGGSVYPGTGLQFRPRSLWSKMRCFRA